MVFGGHHQPTLADDAAGPKVAAQSATRGTQRRKLRGDRDQTGKYFLLFTKKHPQEYVSSFFRFVLNNLGCNNPLLNNH